MLRKLGIFDRAMIIANKHAPFNIVSVLRLENPPSPTRLKNALQEIQRQQPLLQARIIEKDFEALEEHGFPFKVIERTSPNQWREIAEEEMAYRYDHTTGPLFRAIYVYSDDGYGELILNAHHTIMDAASGMKLLDKILRLSAGEAAERPPIELAPVLEEKFPPQHHGLRRVFNTGRYALAQTGDMMRFAWQTRGKRIPPVRLGGRGYTSSLILPGDLVNRLARQGRKKGITLNSLLNAAQVIAVNRHLYNGQPVPMQTFIFPDLRPYLDPPTGTENLANYISMMRFTLNISSESDLWQTAHQLQSQVYRALKSGEKFSASLMSETLLRAFTTLKAMRFGAAALNYASNVPLRNQYGEIKLVGLHGFVSAYDLWPEMSSQARLFNDEVWWDFIYLDTDMDADLAEKVIAEIKLILESASQSHV
jgi:NRPS condensation-like uncharacterized protein